MNKQTRLVVARGIFIFIIFVCLGVIVVTEKASGILIPKVKEKMIDYFETNYNQIKEEVSLQDPTYENTKYSMKITSKENENHYFYLYYQKKEITDSYQKDYVEGNKLLETIKKELEETIREKTNITSIVTIPSTLNQYTSVVQDRIIKGENLLELKFYLLEKDLTIKDWSEESITKEITNYIKTNLEKNITPKSYTIRITNQKDITESIEIQNLTEEFIENENQKEIIHDIINHEETELLEQNKIIYKVLN